MEEHDQEDNNSQTHNQVETDTDGGQDNASGSKPVDQKPTRKRPGRPPGSKNKKTAPSRKKVKTTHDRVDPSHTPKRRGRPPKEQKREPQEKPEKTGELLSKDETEILHDKTEEEPQFGSPSYPDEGEDDDLRYPLIWLLPVIAARPFQATNEHDLTGLPEYPKWTQPGVKGVLVGWSKARALTESGPGLWANAYLPITLRPKTKAPYMELVDVGGKMIKATEVIFLPQYTSEIKRIEQALSLLKDYRDAWTSAVKYYRIAMILWRQERRAWEMQFAIKHLDLPEGEVEKLRRWVEIQKEKGQLRRLEIETSKEELTDSKLSDFDIGLIGPPGLHINLPMQRMISGWPVSAGDFVQSILQQNKKAVVELTKTLNRVKKVPVQRKQLPETKEQEIELLITPLDQGVSRKMAASMHIRIVAWKLERHLHWFDGSAGLYTNDQPALREFFQIDSPQNVANGLEGSTGSLGLLNALRLKEDIQTYPWGLPEYAFLREVTRRSGTWSDIITEQARALLKMIEAWYFQLTVEHRRCLQGKRIVLWALPDDLLATLTYFMDGFGTFQRSNESCEVEYPTAL
ncbi:hypothetical protein BDV33DRAFT_210293 [Aspergillus novoparasiticus]|uniref:Uncharacterized protein n=1 Tax=Aspergillus novoparasiticus TaxID=986946 RepID=A0A5N6E710_9EURO|nr:hypothetical protein BDV33DRAFT_210293 [Aspergillus novoparasiticus]